MLDRNQFTETLHLVQEIAKTSDKPMGREEALSYFKDMELSSEQQEMVYQFLQLPPEEEEALQEDPPADAAEEPENGEEGSRNQTAHFQMYMEEISEIAMLEKEQEQHLYRRLLDGDADAVGAISHQWLRRIVRMAEEYQNETFYLDDLVQEGNMALLIALNQYLGKGETPELEKKLVESVMDAMEQFMGLESGELQREETILAKVSLLHEAKALLKQENGQEPTLQQLADYTKLAADEICDILSLTKEETEGEKED